MGTGRVEAFSDGVIAIIITIMLIPFVTGYPGQNHTAPLAVVMYGGCALLAYFIPEHRPAAGE